MTKVNNQATETKSLSLLQKLRKKFSKDPLDQEQRFMEGREDYREAWNAYGENDEDKDRAINVAKDELQDRKEELRSTSGRTVFLFSGSSLLLASFSFFLQAKAISPVVVSLVTLGIALTGGALITAINCGRSQRRSRSRGRMPAKVYSKLMANKFNEFAMINLRIDRIDAVFKLITRRHERGFILLKMAVLVMVIAAVATRLF